MPMIWSIQLKTNQGIFTLRSRRMYIPSNLVHRLEDGTIIWEMVYPYGVLIQYPDRTRRFISDNWWL